MEFNKKLTNVDFSGIGKIVKKANEIGGDLVRMEIGDVEFDPPPSILQGIQLAFLEKKTHYPPFQGDPELIAAIVNWISRFNEINIKPEQVLVTAGGSMALYISLQTILNNGDEVLIPGPVWPHLKEMVTLSGGIPKIISSTRKNNFHIDFELLTKNITSRTKAILINTPNNPTGTIYTNEEINQLAVLAAKYDLTIISDEEYEVFSFQPMTSPIQTYHKSIICRSFSKMFSMSGLRLGFLVAPADWIPVISKWNLYSSMYNSSIVQRAVAKALTESRDFVTDLVEVYKKRMIKVATALNEIPGVQCDKSEGGIYVWPSFQDIDPDDVKIAGHLLENGKVVMVPGSIFGDSGKGFQRISLACSEIDIDKAIIRITDSIISFTKSNKFIEI